MPSLLVSLLLACSSGPADAPTVGADTADPMPGDTGPEDTGSPTDDDPPAAETCGDAPIACDGPCAWAADLELWRVDGDVEGGWGCFSSLGSIVRFVDPATGRLVDVSEPASSSYSTWIPAGTYDVYYEPCNARDRKGGGGYWLAQDLVVDGAGTIDLALQGVDVSGTVTVDGVVGSSDSEVRFYATSGSEIPSWLIEDTDDGYDGSDAFHVPVDQGHYEMRLPRGTYWVERGSQVLGPVEVDGSGTLDLAFETVDVALTVEVDGVEVDGATLYLHPVGAPGDVYTVRSTESGEPERLTPGTYEVWLKEAHGAGHPVLGFPRAAGTVAIDHTGTATVSFSMQEAELDVSCHGESVHGDAGVEPLDRPPDVVWGYPYYYSETGIGSSPKTVLLPHDGEAWLDLAIDDGDCEGDHRRRVDLSSADHELTVDLEVHQVTLEPTLDGEPWDTYVGLYRLDHGGLVQNGDLDTGVHALEAGEYLVVADEDGVAVEQVVDIDRSGAIPVDFTSVPVDVDWSLYLDGEPHPYRNHLVQFAPVWAAGVVPDYPRVVEVDGIGETLRLTPGVYSVALQEDTVIRDVQARAGECFEVGE